MSKEELDNLFKNKLQDHKREPSANAWDRLEQQLPAEHKGFIMKWWQVAAAILLLCVAGMVYWTNEPASTLATNNEEGSSPTPQEIADNAQVTTEDPGSQEEILIDPETTEKELVQPDEQIAQTTKPTKSIPGDNQETRDSNPTEKIPVVEPDNSKITEVIQDEPVVLPSEIKTAEALAVNELSEPSTNDVTRETLRISIEEFDEALLPKETPTTDAQDSTSKKSGLKKLWATVKNAPSKLETGFGDLREAKNDLLTFNKETE